jgi:hypothetical protein
VKPFLAALTGTAFVYIVIALIVLKLIARRVVGASWIPLFDGVVSVLLGAMSLGFLNPAGVPVIGLAFAAAGFVHESREGKRAWMFVFLAIGTALCAYATFIAFHHTGDDYHP